MKYKTTGVLLAVWMGVAPAVRAEVKNVWLGVNGATCATCAYSLDKGLRRLDGVSRTRLTTGAPAHLDVTLKPGVWVDPARMTRVVNDVGYEARRDDVRLTVVGRLEIEGTGYRLVVGDVSPAQAFSLVAYAGKDGGSRKASGGGMAALPGLAGHPVELSGFWKPDADGPGASLAVLKVAVATPPADLPKAR